MIFLLNQIYRHFIYFIDNKPIVGMLCSFSSSILAFLTKTIILVQYGGLAIGFGIGIITFIRACKKMKREDKISDLEERIKELQIKELEQKNKIYNDIMP